MVEEKKLILLKELLLTDDRILIDSLMLRIKELESIIEHQEGLSTKVNPIIDNKLEEYTRNIPIVLGPSILESLKNEILNSKDGVVDALYPIIGKMIKKYIRQEFRILSEKINNKLKKSFSFKSLARKFKSKITGVDEDSLIINELAKTEIQEIFIIDRNSGILLANFSKTHTIDKEVISAMLSAIKSFVEEAFKAGEENLESVEYGLYNIHIQNFKSFFIAVVLHGVFESAYKAKLESQLLSFVAKNIPSTTNTNLSDKLAEAFTKDVV